MLMTGHGWAGSSANWEFESDDLKVVEIGIDAVYDDARSYQIVVSDDLSTIARLEVNRDGLVTDVWLTDLDRDGSCRHFRRRVMLLLL